MSLSLAFFIFLAIMSALDVYSTYLALKRPGVYESNGLLRPILKRKGGFWVLSLIKLGFLAYIWVKLDVLPAPLVALLGVLLVPVVADNFKNARK